MHAKSFIGALARFSNAVLLRELREIDVVECYTVLTRVDIFHVVQVLMGKL